MGTSDIRQTGENSVLHLISEENSKYYVVVLLRMTH